MSLRTLFLATLLVLPAVPQGADAVLTGTATDPSGAAVPGAGITALHLATGVSQTAETNPSGIYVFPSLAPGVYRVTAEKQGFQTLRYDDVRLEVGGRLSLNLALQLGSLAETVEVRATSENLLGYDTASVGGMVTGHRVNELPLPARSALNLTYTQAGLYEDNIAGSRIGATNITLDGVNIQDQRLNQGISSPIFLTVDKIEEFRIVTSPADAELGRGSGQIQMLTRSGTNEFHGSLFEAHRNTVLNANTWFNNYRGTDARTGEPVSPRNILIRNQYGGRLGGPIIRNQTFFHFLFEEQKIRQRTAVTNTVYTAPAREGVFRFFPGARNGNAVSSAPTVDLNGNPVRPAGATGDLQSVRLFGRDPNRMAADPTGIVKRMIDLTPLPNNFRFGDGLNTAGFTWQRPGDQNLRQFNIKIDHNINSYHRFAATYTHENQKNYNGWSESPFPNTPAGESSYRDRLATFNIWSTLRSNILNEFRFGSLRPWLRYYTGWEVGDNGRLLPRAGDETYVIVFDTIADPINQADNPVGRISPLYQFTDNVSWIRGRHSFKGGFEIRFSSTNGFNSTDVMPRATTGTGTSSIQNVSNIPGIGQNLTAAYSLLNNLSGSLTRISQTLNSPGGPNPVFLSREVKQRTWKRREISMFFKDDFKVSPNLTLNLGMRWEFYGVPYDANARTAALVGGSGSLFGISGRSFADLYQPGRLAGDLTRVEIVGPGSENPSRKLHGEDWNNFGPAVGLSWAAPWFGKRTVLRMGYSISYERNSLRIVDVVSGDQPGLRERVFFNSASHLNLTSVALPLKPLGKPLDLVPLTDRSQTVRTFDDNLRNPYIQNWSFGIQRELAKNTILELRYAGSKGTRLVRGLDINEQIIFENGILDAFRVTQKGGHAPLLDRIFNGISIPGLGRVDGQRITGSDAVRYNSTTQSYLAFHNVASFANWLNTTTSYTGERGGLPRRAGLPENFITGNPQFASARLTSNVAGSTWNSFQAEVSKRFSAGWTWQGNYTWSKALGEEEGAGEEMIDSYRDLRNWRLDKRLMRFHRTHILRNSGTVELPFGPKRKYLNSSHPVLSRLAERWQFGFVFNVFSGAPFSLTSGRNSWNTFGDNTPAAVAPLDKGAGNVLKTGNGVVYFDGFQQVRDPSIEGLTTLNGIQGRSTLLAIADSGGKVILVNPTPGTLGNLAPNFLEGPGDFRLDINLIKRVRLNERAGLEFRIDAIDVSNTPHFNLPNADMNSTTFGRITGASGNRILVVGARINF